MLLTNRTGVKNTRALLRAFGGLNETYGCTEAEYSGGMNFSARDFPALSTRLPRRRLQELAGQAGGDSFSILLQVLAIAFVAQLAADLCREAGLAAAAFCMEFVGRILAMLQALPLLQSLLASFLSVLS